MGDTKDKQINIRLDDETMGRLLTAEQQSGLGASELIRSFIWNGQVNVCYGEKEIIRHISNMHDALNRNHLRILSEIQYLEKILEQVQASCGQIADSRELCCLINDTITIIEHWKMDSRKMQETVERSIMEDVNIQGRK